MSQLRCVRCQQLTPSGFTCCPYCNVGFAAPLECVSCGHVMQPGSSTCFRCDRSLDNATSSALVPPQFTPTSDHPPQIGVALYTPPQRVEEMYLAGRHGVDAQVVIPAGDVEVMNLMGQATMLLRMLADKMNQFRGHMPMTRENIKSCRRLADDLQEEVEVRRGPRG